MDAVQISTLAQSGPNPGGRVQVPVAASRDGPAPVAARPAAPPPANPELTDAGRKAVEQAVAQIRKFVQSSAAELEFSVDNASGRVIVRVTDSQTKEVIRQLPSEEVLAISRALDRFQGLLLAQKA
jgi:flagellar protein FlaG